MFDWKTGYHGLAESTYKSDLDKSIPAKDSAAAADCVHYIIPQFIWRDQGAVYIEPVKVTIKELSTARKSAIWGLCWGPAGELLYRLCSKNKAIIYFLETAHGMHNHGICDYVTESIIR